MTLEEVKQNIRTAKLSVSITKGNIVTALEASHTMWHWADMCGLFNKINHENDFLLTVGLWSLLEDEGIYLTKAEKKEIFINFIED